MLLLFSTKKERKYGAGAGRTPDVSQDTTENLYKASRKHMLTQNPAHLDSILEQC